jgi:putative component of membrane protein insertase Oxa1/YidC/SpoIIIJ protein YidD
MIATAASDARNRWSVRCLAALITAYQRYVSPYKGFCCAHRVAHGGLSCSAYAKRQLLRRGIGATARSMRARFAACAAAAVMLHAAAADAGGDDTRRRRAAPSDTSDLAHCCTCVPDPVTPLLVHGADGACQAAACADAGSCAGATACLPF